jgi:hypothetical protein
MSDKGFNLLILYLEIGQGSGLVHCKAELDKLPVYGLFSGVKSNWFGSGVK